MRMNLALFTLFSTALATIGDYCSASQGTGICRTKSSCTKGFTVTGACPNDPSNVLCCIESTCSIDAFSGTCQDKTAVALPCLGSYLTGLCPGSTNVQCCILRNGIDAFIDDVKKIYNLALAYKVGGKTANQLVMEWYRHEDYNDFRWKALIGGVDDGWIAHVKSSGVVLMKSFMDPYYKTINVETSHTFAAMNGAFIKGQATGTGYNRGDIAGWGGDLFTFYGEWRRDDVDSGKQYCLDNLAKDNKSTFKLLDAVEDADGYNIASTLRANPARSIADEVAAYYKPRGKYQTRFQDFFKGRFGGTLKGAADIACEIMVPGDDVTINAGRTALIEMTAGTLVKLPFWLSDEELRGFCDGFAEVFSRLPVAT